MSLEWYVRPRLVALKSTTSVLDAARAVEQNNIGAVVVQDKGSVVGIVTDRDLAIRALGRGLDPHKTTVGEVITAGVISLAPTDTQASAIRLMHKRNIRRIALVEGAIRWHGDARPALMARASVAACRSAARDGSLNCWASLISTAKNV